MTESETENTVNSDNPPLPEAETETQVRPEPDSEPERLQKVLSRAGVASRRASEDLIAQGRVQINGETVREMGVSCLRTGLPWTASVFTPIRSCRSGLFTSPLAPFLRCSPRTIGPASGTG